MEQENLPPIVTIPQGSNKRFIKRLLLILILIDVSTSVVLGGFAFYRLKYIPKISDQALLQRPRIELKENLERIATIDQGDLNDFNAIAYPYAPTPSNDGRNIAYVLKKSGRDVLVVNNEKSKPFAEIFYPTFAPDNSHYCTPAYLERRYGDVMMLCNNYESAVFSDVNSPASFSPDGKHFGFLGRRLKGKVFEWFAVVDGKEFGPYSNVGVTKVVFSSDSNHFAYAAEQDGKMHLFLDGKANNSYPESLMPVFSSSGKIFFNAKDKDGKWYVIADGKKEIFASDKPLSGGINFSEDGTRYIYFPYLGNSYAVLDGQQKVTLPDGITLIKFIGFSLDKTHYAFEAINQDLQSVNFRSLNEYMVVDGVLYGPYKQLGLESIFLPDSGEFIFSALQGDKWLLFSNGKVIREIGAEARGLVLDSTKRKIAFMAASSNGSFVFYGDKKYGPYGSVSDLVITNDGRTVFIASDYSTTGSNYYDEKKQKESAYMIVDGVAGTKYDRIINTKFSADKSSFAFEGISQKYLIDLIINVRGKEIKVPSANGINFSPDGSRFTYRKLDLLGKVSDFVVGNDIIKDYEFGNGIQSEFGDSGELAFVGKKNGKDYVVLEGRPSSMSYDRILKIGVLNGKIYYVALSGNEIWRGEFK